MQKSSPVFPNCNYLLILDPPKDQVKVMQEIASRHECRLLFCQSSRELSSAVSSIKRALGVFVFADAKSMKINQEALPVVRQVGAPLRFLSPTPPGGLRDGEYLPLNGALTEQDFDRVLGNFVGTLAPKGLDKVMLNAAKLIVPTFFPGTSEFSLVPYGAKGYDLQINFYLSGGSMIGQGIVKLNRMRLRKLFPADDGNRLIDSAAETGNQFLGVVRQSLAKVSVDMTIGLPSTFDLTRIPNVQTLNYFPSWHIENAEQSIQMSLGFTDLENRPIFDLSGINFEESSDDVEFL